MIRQQLSWHEVAHKRLAVSWKGSLQCLPDVNSPILIVCVRGFAAPKVADMVFLLEDSTPLSGWSAVSTLRRASSRCLHRKRKLLNCPDKKIFRQPVYRNVHLLASKLQWNPVCKTSPVLSCRVFLRMSFYNGINRVFQSSTPRRTRANGWLTACHLSHKLYGGCCRMVIELLVWRGRTDSCSRTPRMLMLILPWGIRGRSLTASSICVACLCNINWSFRFPLGLRYRY